jgi:hypothetical protein
VVWEVELRDHSEKDHLGLDVLSRRPPRMRAAASYPKEALGSRNPYRYREGVACEVVGSFESDRRLLTSDRLLTTARSVPLHPGIPLPCTARG